MSETRGGCLCGAVRYRFDEAPSLVANCYCRDCQRATGSPFTTILAVSLENFEMIAGETAQYTVTSDTDREVTRLFCPKCGSPMFTRAEMMPDVIFIKCATLDDPDAVHPSTNFWTASAPSWAPIAEVEHSFAANPPD